MTPEHFKHKRGNYEKDLIAAKVNFRRNSKAVLKEYFESRPADMPHDVHTGHCCFIHGCKYDDQDCSVVTGKLIQDDSCWYCNDPII